jgi:hypothetical protein
MPQHHGGVFGERIPIFHEGDHRVGRIVGWSNPDFVDRLLHAAPDIGVVTACS